MSQMTRAIWFALGAVALGSALLFAGTFKWSVIGPDPNAVILPPENLGQLRAGAVTNPYPVHFYKIDTPQPVGRAGVIASAGGLTLLMTRRGALLRFADGAFQPLDVPLPFDVDAMADGFPLPNARDWMGVYDLVFRADGEGWELFISWASYDPPARCLQLKASALRLTGSFQPDGGWREIYASDPCITTGGNQISLLGGGAMLLEADRLLIGVGTFSLDGLTYPEELDFLRSEKTDYGKLVEIDMASGATRHVARGLRDPTGIARGRDGGLWSVEHGPRGGDELNLILEDADYGWPLSTYGTDYGKLEWPATSVPDADTRFETPRYSWVPSIAPSSMIRLSGPGFQKWRGDLLISTLKAARLYRVRTHEGRVVLAEPILIGERVRDLAQTADGTILALLDRLPWIVRIPDPTVGADGARLLAAPDEMRLCAACHLVGADDPGPGTAPPLTAMIGKPMARYPGYAYSPAFSALDGTWDRASLSAFLEDAQGFVRGTSHPDLDLAAFRRRMILDWLEAN